MALDKSSITLPDAQRLSFGTELFDVLEELPDSAFHTRSTSWMSSGLTWTTRDCDGISTEITHCTEGNPLQAGVTLSPEEHQGGGQTECIPDERGSFMLWAAMGASTLDINDGDTAGEVLGKVGDFVQYAMAQELVTGAIGGRGLADVATPIVGGPVTVANGAIGHMEEWLGTRVGNTRGILHVSKTTLAALYAATAITERNGRYYTPSGHEVLADAGYQESILAPNGGVLSTGANGWAYITGPIWYRTTMPKVLGEHWERMNWDDNTADAVATAYGVFAFKACAVGSMLITY